MLRFENTKKIIIKEDLDYAAQLLPLIPFYLLLNITGLLLLLFLFYLYEFILLGLTRVLIYSYVYMYIMSQGVFEGISCFTTFPA